MAGSAETPTNGPIRPFVHERAVIAWNQDFVPLPYPLAERGGPVVQHPRDQRPVAAGRYEFPGREERRRCDPSRMPVQRLLEHSAGRRPQQGAGSAGRDDGPAVGAECTVDDDLRRLQQEAFGRIVQIDDPHGRPPFADEHRSTVRADGEDSVAAELTHERARPRVEDGRRPEPTRIELRAVGREPHPSEGVSPVRRPRVRSPIGESEHHRLIGNPRSPDRDIPDVVLVGERCDDRCERPVR